MKSRERSERQKRPKKNCAVVPRQTATRWRRLRISQSNARTLLAVQRRRSAARCLPPAVANCRYSRTTSISAPSPPGQDPVASQPSLCRCRSSRAQVPVRSAQRRRRDRSLRLSWRIRHLQILRDDGSRRFMSIAVLTINRRMASGFATKSSVTRTA